MNKIDLEIINIKDACDRIKMKVYDLDIPRNNTFSLWDMWDEPWPSHQINKDYTPFDNQTEEVLNMCSELALFADSMELMYNKAMNARNKL